MAVILDSSLAAFRVQTNSGRWQWFPWERIGHAVAGNPALFFFLLLLLLLIGCCRLLIEHSLINKQKQAGPLGFLVVV
jgi:hypothetical protein